MVSASLKQSSVMFQCKLTLECRLADNPAQISRPAALPGIVMTLWAPLHPPSNIAA
jgi:hypothetical protein